MSVCCRALQVRSCFPSPAGPALPRHDPSAAAAQGLPAREPAPGRVAARALPPGRGRLPRGGAPGRAGRGGGRALGRGAGACEQRAGAQRARAVGRRARGPAGCDGGVGIGMLSVLAGRAAALQQCTSQGCTPQRGRKAGVCLLRACASCMCRKGTCMVWCLNKRPVICMIFFGDVQVQPENKHTCGHF